MKNYPRMSILMIITAFIFTGCFSLPSKRVVITTQGAIEEYSKTIENLKQENEELGDLIKKKNAKERRKSKIASRKLEKICDEYSETYGEPIIMVNAIISDGETNDNVLHIWITDDAIYIANYIDEKPVSVNTIPLIKKLNK